MVKKGNFELQLVDADTPDYSFQEHIAEDGTPFIEVEPDAEYFLKIGINSDFKSVTYTMQVDGEDLGYMSTNVSCKGAMRGLWSLNKGQETHKALKFRGLYDQTEEETNISLPNDSNGGDGDWVGEIVVSFFEYIELEEYADIEDKKPNWRGSQTSVNCEKKKSVKSGKGTTTKTKAASRKVKNWKIGNIIETITVKYCTTVGLIHIGVLPKPPYWNWARVNFPDEALHLKTKLVEPEILKFTTTNQDGNVVEEDKNVELFDLTVSDESDFSSSSDESDATRIIS